MTCQDLIDNHPHIIFLSWIDYFSRDLLYDMFSLFSFERSIIDTRFTLLFIRKINLLRINPIMYGQGDEKVPTAIGLYPSVMQPMAMADDPQIHRTRKTLIIILSVLLVGRHRLEMDHFRSR